MPGRGREEKSWGEEKASNQDQASKGMRMCRGGGQNAKFLGKDHKVAQSLVRGVGKESIRTRKAVEIKKNPVKVNKWTMTKTRLGGM